MKIVVLYQVAVAKTAVKTAAAETLPQLPLPPQPRPQPLVLFPVACRRAATRPTTLVMERWTRTISDVTRAMPTKRALVLPLPLSAMARILMVSAKSMQCCSVTPPLCLLLFADFLLVLLFQFVALATIGDRSW